MSSSVIKHKPRLKRDRSPSSESFTQPVQRPLAKMRRLDDVSDDEEAEGEGEEEVKPSQVHDPYPDAVGSLVCEIPNEEMVRIVITLQQVVIIGRHSECDFVLRYPSISRRHLRLTPVRTNSQFTMVALSDLSRYGFTLNGVFHRPDRVAKIDTKRIQCKTYILKTGDRVELPDCPAVFTWVQGPAHAVELVCHPNRSPPIFTTADDREKYMLQKAWVVHNCPLGSGTFGTVNMASHSNASWLQVACKTIAKPKTPEDVQALQDEVAILKRMDHPNLNGILDRVNDETPHPRVHLILELMTGGDLFAYCEKHPGGLEELEVKWIASQLVDGLSYLHNMEIAHRDIKPENILLAVSAIFPRVVIGDFGHAISYDAVFETVPASEFTREVREFPRIGTASYIPPERLKVWCRKSPGLSGLAENVGRSRNDGRTRRERIAHDWFTEELLLDAWALGVTLYTTAFGEHPYEGGPSGTTEIQREQTEHQTPSRSYTQVKGRNSWANFCKAEGEGRSIGTSRKETETTTRYFELLSHFKRDAPKKWFTFRRGQVSESFIEFAQGLLEPRPDDRTKVLSCRSREWLEEDQRFLDKMYDHVIVHKEVLHFDKVQQILEDLEHEAGVPSSLPGSTQTSMLDESPSTRWMKLAGPRHSPIESIDPPSPIHEGDEDIEMDETGDVRGGEDTIVDDTFEDDGDATYEDESGARW